MKEKDAEIVLDILTNADGGCPYCASYLFHIFIRKYPQFQKLAETIFKERFYVGLNEEQ